MFFLQEGISYLKTKGFVLEKVETIENKIYLYGVFSSTPYTFSLGKNGLYLTSVKGHSRYLEYRDDKVWYSHLYYDTQIMEKLRKFDFKNIDNDYIWDNEKFVVTVDADGDLLIKHKDYPYYSKTCIDILDKMYLIFKNRVPNDFINETKINSHFPEKSLAHYFFEQGSVIQITWTSYSLYSTHYLTAKFANGFVQITFTDIHDDSRNMKQNSIACHGTIEQQVSYIKSFLKDHWY